ncbi:MAG: tetratricopeptide repeat protein [Synergistaceae bacterium]|nr:tetratricopeptide repeat protein [Synergistaceae bacterium]
MNRQRGGFFSGLVIVLVIILLSATAFLALATMREKNIVKPEALLRSGDYYGAAQIFRKAEKFSLRPGSRVVKGLAESSLGMEDYETAAKYYEKLVKLEPDNVEARYKLGLLYIRAKNYGAAEKEVQALRAIGTENALSGAETLAENLSSGKIKGFFRDLLKKVAPGLPDIPGITQDDPIKTGNEEAAGDTLSENQPEAKDGDENIHKSEDTVTE